ncbi:MAG TPA: glycosyltransferase family 39 protein [Acidimicrobiales bacterium]|nr:glycosyltransferase family 39 protein [Acidimicrobiales bacterium]
MPATSAEGHPGQRGGRGIVAAVVVLAVAAGVWALVGSQLIFPYLSDDHDEGLYLLQATALADGDLFPAAPEQADAFRPWLSVLDGDRYVLKYTPVHAAVLAVGMRFTGSARSSLALVAAGVVLLSYALAKEVLGERKLAALAAAFLAVSPLFIVQSATFLPYCSTLLLLEGFAVALLRGARTNGRLLLALSGLVFGVVLFARPFDALLWAFPLGVYVVVTQRSDARRLRRTAGWFALGSAAPVLAMLAYYRAATGSPFRTPFNLLEPRDTLGFGARRLVPGAPDLIFTPAHGIYGIVRYVMITSAWVFGGLVLVGFFLAGLVRRRGRGPLLWLASIVLTFSFGYLFFWGTFGTSLRGGLSSFLGPFYLMPVLVPLTFVAAKGFAALWRHDRFLGTAALVAMLVVSGYLLSRALPVNLRFSAEDRRIYASIASARLDRALVLVPPLYGPQLLHPLAFLQNDADYDGRIVYALDRGERGNLRLLDDFPGREVFKLRFHGRYRANPIDRGLRTSLEPLTVVDQDSFPFVLSFDNPGDDPRVVVSVTLGRTRHSLVLDTASVRGRRHELRFSAGPSSVELRSPVRAHLREAVEDEGLLSVSVRTGPSDGLSERTVYERSLAHRPDGTSVRILFPGHVSVDELGAEDRDPLRTSP